MAKTQTADGVGYVTPGEIRHWREIFGWSVADLAHQANLSVGIVSEAEQGNLKPSGSFRPAFFALSMAISEEKKRILRLAEEIQKYCISR